MHMYLSPLSDLCDKQFAVVHFWSWCVMV